MDLWILELHLLPTQGSDRPGGTVYFDVVLAKPMLKRVTLMMGQPVAEFEVDAFPQPMGLWTLSLGGIYLVPADAPRSLRYYDFASKQIRPIFEVDRNFGSGLSVSPDGRWILYSQVGDVNSDIMLVDPFR